METQSFRAPSEETRLCLVRHGETDWNRAGRAQGREDIPLNAVGRSQARRLAQRLARERWDGIYSSPLSRAYETARAVAEAAGLEVQTDPRLQERHMGAAAGLTWEERQARFPGLKLEAIPGAEDWDSLTRRMEAALVVIARRHPGGRVLVVSHGAAINSLIRSVTGETAPLPNTSLTWAVYSGDGWRLEEIGDAGHLDPAAAD